MNRTSGQRRVMSLNPCVCPTVSPAVVGIGRTNSYTGNDMRTGNAVVVGSVYALCALQWRQNERDGVSNNRRLDCLLNRLFRRRLKKTSKLRVTALCEGNSPVTGEFPAQRAVMRKMFLFDDVIVFATWLKVCANNHRDHVEKDLNLQENHTICYTSTITPPGWIIWTVFWNVNTKNQLLRNKANLRDLIAATGLVILLKFDPNHRFLSPCDLEIWCMTSKNNRAPLLYYIKLCVSFQIHRWIQTEFTVRKRSIRVKIGDFLSHVTLKFDGWPWKTIGHLFYYASSFVHHFTAISEFKLELQSGNAQFGSKLTNFF